MHGLTIDGARRKWYHVVLRTYRRRPLFKIPAAQRFCERELLRELERLGWTVETIRCRPASLHLLVQPPRGHARNLIVAELREVATAVHRRGASAARARRRLWDDRVWCATVSHGAGFTAVRRHLRGQRADAVSISTPGAIVPP